MRSAAKGCSMSNCAVPDISRIIEEARRQASASVKRPEFLKTKTLDAHVELLKNRRVSSFLL